MATSERGFASRLVAAQLDDVARQLRRATVFFAKIDDTRQTNELVGSGVVADLEGTKVILTAGHVLSDYAREFEDGRVALSVHRDRGSFRVRPDTERLRSPGDERGADAGVLIPPPDQVETYFQFSGVEPVRMSTLRISPPDVDMDCIVAGYPTALAAATTVEGPTAIEIRLVPDFVVLVAHFVESDPVHYWLYSAMAPFNIETGEDVAFEPGNLKGMSGCGFWTIEQHDTEARFALHGVHTGTGHDRLRETPIVHHLRLLAGHRERWRTWLASKWPGLALE